MGSCADANTGLCMCIVYEAKLCHSRIGKLHCIPLDAITYDTRRLITNFDVIGTCFMYVF